jgi:FtsP/CotA-like multicopper oxidase with cupredoxin domain
VLPDAFQERRQVCHRGGPHFTVVNGKIWPVLDVQPATYRLRVLNGSNARSYRLLLFRGSAPDLDRIVQIGTDHGLLRAPVPVPTNGILLASAERADLLIDFSDLEPGTELTLLNTAVAPFDGSSFPAANAENAADLDGLLPYPQVMRFRVTAGASAPLPIPGILATDYAPPAAGVLAAAPRRAIALVEQEREGEPNMLTMRELAPAGDDDGLAVTLIAGGRTIRYRAVAAHFEDTTTFFPVLDRYEVWQLINLTPDTHPIHVHLDPFQILARHPIRHEIPEGGIRERDLAATIRLERAPDDELEHTIDDNERGLKDTFA